MRDTERERNRDREEKRKSYVLSSPGMMSRKLNAFHQWSTVGKRVWIIYPGWGGGGLAGEERKDRIVSVRLCEDDSVCVTNTRKQTHWRSLTYIESVGFPLSPFSLSLITSFCHSLFLPVMKSCHHAQCCAPHLHVWPGFALLLLKAINPWSKGLKGNTHGIIYKIWAPFTSSGFFFT